MLLGRSFFKSEMFFGTVFVQFPKTGFLACRAMLATELVKKLAPGVGIPLFCCAVVME